MSTTGVTGDGEPLHFPMMRCSRKLHEANRASMTFRRRTAGLPTAYVRLHALFTVHLTVPFILRGSKLRVWTAARRRTTTCSQTPQPRTITSTQTTQTVIQH